MRQLCESDSGSQDTYRDRRQAKDQATPVPPLPVRQVGDSDQVYVEGIRTSSAPLFAQWSETRADLLGKELWLLAGHEVTAFGELVVMDEFGMRFLYPTPCDFATNINIL